MYVIKYVICYGLETQFSMTVMAYCTVQCIEDKFQASVTNIRT